MRLSLNRKDLSLRFKCAGFENTVMVERSETSLVPFTCEKPTPENNQRFFASLRMIFGEI
jgi:hypothetical protein